MYEETLMRLLRYRDRMREKRMREENLRDLEERVRTESNHITRFQYIKLLCARAITSMLEIDTTPTIQTHASTAS